MDSQTIGVFYNSAERDHECTLLGLEGAYRRARALSRFFRADAAVESASAARRNQADDLSPLAAIALEPEFALDAELSQAIFLFDSAVDFTDYPWRGGELDALANAPRAAAFDIRPWAYFKTMFAREIPLLPAPLPPARSTPISATTRVTIIVNDAALARESVGELRDTIRALVGDIVIEEIRNPFRAPMGQSDWAASRQRATTLHVHVGFPPDLVSFGRLIDSMAMRAPCLVFEPAATRYDAGVALNWRRPNYAHDVNMALATDAKAFAEAARLILKDRAFAQHLIRNGLKEVAIFHEEAQKALLALTAPVAA